MSTRSRNGHLQPFDREIGARIRAVRIMRGLSQTELGKPIRVSFQQIQKYEKGANAVAPSRLKGIAQALHVSMAALLGEERLP